MALNAPRTIPYDFKVFEMEGVVWLFDDSSRHYLCSAQAMIWADTLYWLDDDCDDDLLDGEYFDPDVVKEAKTVPGEYPFDMSEEEAWQNAREEANANHLL